MNRRKLIVGPCCAALAWLGLTTLVLAHPSIEGGIKQGFVGVKMGGYTHIELVADPKTNEVRLFISRAIDEQVADKKHEWVVNMTVRNESRRTAAGEEKLVLLPLPDLGAGKDWFAVTPVRTKDGFHFYRIEATARVVLDGNAAGSRSLTFQAGKAPNGVHCLSAPLDLSKAKTIRVEDVTVKVLDAENGKAAIAKTCFEKMAWGIGGLHKTPNKVDFALSKFSEAIAKIPEMDKFRKPELP